MWLPMLAAAAALVVSTHGASETQPVMDMLTRVVGASSAAIFELKLCESLTTPTSAYFGGERELCTPAGTLVRKAQSRTDAWCATRSDTSMAQGFSLAAATDSASAATVSVTASGLPELAYGAGYYLRTEAGMSFACE